MRSESETVFEDAPPKPSWKVIILLVVFMLVLMTCVAAWKFPFLFMPSPYLSFMRKDLSYYSQVAHACDSILQHHPVTASNSVTRYGEVLPFTLSLSGSDTSLPKIIRALHPDDILVSSNRIFIDIPPERMGGFGVSWGQNELQTNQWILQSHAEGPGEIVYQENRP
jgi:hypothetical protein